MLTGEPDAQASPPPLLAGPSWPVTVILGALTLIVGLAVAFHPAGSLNVAAVLLGVLMILSGIFNLIRVFDREEAHRVWLGVAGLMFIVVGVVLIRHLHLTVAVIGLLIGITWIVQGLAARIGGISSDAREGRAGWIACGCISLIAGIGGAATPVSSLTVLTVLLGIWFIVMGIFEIIGGLMLRRESRVTVMTLT